MLSSHFKGLRGRVLAWNLQVEGVMSNENYLIRATAIACLLLGSLATVIIVAQRPAPDAPVANAKSADSVQVASK
jgi:hypothetical protein